MAIALPARRLGGLVLGVAVVALACCSCDKTNPLGVGAPTGSQTTTYSKQPEPLDVPGVFFAPQNNQNGAIQFLSPMTPFAPYAGAFLDV
ncbi:MAG: hypothetical protein ACREKE_02020, partial [bacterium]